jgi:hypothetical protein
MGMWWYFRVIERDGFFTVFFTNGTVCQVRALPYSDHGAPPQIGEHKSGIAITAINIADHGKKRLVIADLQRLPSAKHPPRRSIIAGKDPDLS